MIQYSFGHTGLQLAPNTNVFFNHTGLQLMFSLIFPLFLLISLHFLGLFQRHKLKFEDMVD